MWHLHPHPHPHSQTRPVQHLAVARIPSANSRPQSARPTRQQQKHQPSHATQPPQQQQEQEQQLQMTAQQQQERRITADVLKVLQTPRYHISADSGVKTALFPQQDLLQPPMQRIPKVMLDLIAAANSQAAADTPLLPSDGATIAAAAAGTPAGKRQASIVNIGSSSSCGSTNHQHSNVSACAHSSSNSSISDSTLPAGCLAVLGTIHEEDSAEQQHQGTVEQVGITSIYGWHQSKHPPWLPSSVRIAGCQPR